ncbi:aminotransferase class I/II-fold pyridoxal phosphate-dependent enzyme [Kangiella sp.]|uniref:aminotransferase class I/II-fold pyridoxal phosphate-dependent enzyme n=1 Tax=Kangiella sp. TaxID=1920245 RepID=UPI00199EC9F4|nr:aminotransferase class I/II-fold pyridoxal phosphate-dependent enzyme [Kangiella sp.]MBD3654674.1 aminotransferase class I/II-fold pyridoxal phosphate-dependent enzyme [Kangiella sp.]
MLPLLKILLIEDDKPILSELTHNLSKTIDNFERTDVTLEVIECDTLAKGLDYIRDDGDIQAVIVSWQIRENAIANRYAQFIDELKSIRLELPVYVLGDDSKGLDIVNESEYIESFFFKDDVLSDPESILGYIINDFDDRCETPFWTAYKRYVAESNDSWHTPGHSGGASFRNSPYIRDFYQFYGRNVFVGDLSVSVDSLGSLSDSTNYIGRAQQAAATTFEVKRTYFVTNGSSTSNKIILQTLLRKGDKVIIDRNCHKSVHYGILQSGSMPIYLSSILNPKYGIFAPPSLADMKLAIKQNPDAKLLVLTGCTYDGLLSDLKQVVDLAHAHNVKVFIDEAWFAYSLFHPQFRYYSAINAGADYVTHSAHKVVSAFSQASYIHINDPDFDEDFFREIFSIYASTSPKYQLIASLDVCHKQLEMEGYKILNSLLNHVAEFKQQMATLNKIKVLDGKDFKHIFPHFESDNMGHDPLKILIDISELPYSHKDIHKYLLDEVGLEIEKYTHSTILVLLTLGGTRSKIIRLYNALKKLDSGRVKLTTSSRRSKIPDNLPPIELACLPNEAFFGARECIPISETENRICAGLVTPYPPGIPLLVPGQIIRRQQLDYLAALTNQNLTIQGSFDGEIYVLKE